MRLSTKSTVVAVGCTCGADWPSPAAMLDAPETGLNVAIAVAKGTKNERFTFSKLVGALPSTRRAIDWALTEGRTLAVCLFLLHQCG